MGPETVAFQGTRRRLHSSAQQHVYGRINELQIFLTLQSEAQSSLVDWLLIANRAVFSRSFHNPSNICNSNRYAPAAAHGGQSGEGC